MDGRIGMGSPVNLDVTKFLEDLSGRYARPYTDAAHDLYVATVTDNRVLARNARKRLYETVNATMGAGEILGATLVLRQAGALLEPQVSRLRADTEYLLLFQDQAVLPRVTLTEAVEDLVTRAPTPVKEAAERMAYQVSRLYAEDRVIAFARAAEASVVEEAQKFITQSLKKGTAEPKAGAGLTMAANEVAKQSRPWTESYARMAFRTNINTAITAGRFRQVQDPAVREVIPAFRYDAVGDRDTRENHLAADGLIMAANNPKWAQIAPPLGWNCRCTVALVSAPMLRRMGRMDRKGNLVEDRVPASARPDPGFRHGGRPDLMISGG
jgi:SPP1 gp7 family putative phage head morphogenesis protein